MVDTADITLICPKNDLQSVTIIEVAKEYCIDVRESLQVWGARDTAGAVAQGGLAVIAVGDVREQAPHAVLQLGGVERYRNIEDAGGVSGAVIRAIQIQRDTRDNSGIRVDAQIGHVTRVVVQHNPHIEFEAPGHLLSERQPGSGMDMAKIGEPPGLKFDRDQERDERIVVINQRQRAAWQ